MSGSKDFDKKSYGRFEKLSVQDALRYRTFLLDNDKKDTEGLTIPESEIIKPQILEISGKESNLEDRYSHSFKKNNAEILLEIWRKQDKAIVHSLGINLKNSSPTSDISAKEYREKEVKKKLQEDMNIVTESSKRKIGSQVKDDTDLSELTFDINSLAVDGHEYFGDVELNIPDENYPANITDVPLMGNSESNTDQCEDDTEIRDIKNNTSREFVGDSIPYDEKKYGTLREVDSSYSDRDEPTKIKTPSDEDGTLAFFSRTVSKSPFPSREELSTFFKNQDLGKDEAKHPDALLEYVSHIDPDPVHKNGNNFLSCIIDLANNSDEKGNNKEKEDLQIPEVLDLETLNKIDSDEKKEMLSDQEISGDVVHRWQGSDTYVSDGSYSFNSDNDDAEFLSNNNYLSNELKTFIEFFEKIYHSMLSHEEQLDMVDTPGYKAYVNLKGKCEAEILRKLMNNMISHIDLKSGNLSEKDGLGTSLRLEFYRNKTMKLGRVPFLLELNYETLISQIISLSEDSVNVEEIHRSWYSFLSDFLNGDGFVLRRDLKTIIISSRPIQMPEISYLHLLISEISNVFGVQPEENLFEPYFRPLDNLTSKEFSKEIETL